MTVYSIPQLAEIWRRNGGSPAHQVDAVAVALAESGGNSNAISPSSDYGLWQINTVNFAHFGLTRTSALNPDTSARVAISMSGNGTNWAAWCTAWYRPADNCGHGFLAHPQIGSNAGDNLARVGAVLGQPSIGSIVGQAVASLTPHVPAVSSAWSGFQDFVGPYARWHHSAVSVTRGLIRGA